VLQPPRIRHRVLDSSPGLEVIEIASPAEHETHADPEMSLPTGTLRPGRVFETQTFCRHEVESAHWEPSRSEQFVARDLGISGATGGLAHAWVLRRADPATWPGVATATPVGKMVFDFVLAGSVTLKSDDRGAHSLGTGDSFVVPAGQSYQLVDCDDALELLEVTLPSS